MEQPADPFDLRRFVDAQRPVFESALAELRTGRKVGHWMWFVFPQVAGLGSSPTARRYAIRSLEEARAYLAHPILGPRLSGCAEAVLEGPERSIERLFGHPDDLKLRSSMTLFEAASDGGSIFGRVLEQAFDGRRDRRTLRLLGLDAGP